MRIAARALLLIVLAVLLAESVEAGRVEAGYISAVRVSPYAGSPGTTVEVTGGSWLPNVSVEISAGFSEVAFGSDPIEYGDIIATTISDDDGQWRVQIGIGREVPVPTTPGFVKFRAVSPNLPPYLEGKNIGTFALIVDGQRPNGAGELRISVSEAPGLGTKLVLLSYRGVGGTAGFINRLSEPHSLPTEVTFRSLPDGDFEVAAEALGGRLPVGPGLYDVKADACAEPICEGHERVYRVQVVSIRNGAVVDVSIFFADAETLPNGGAGPPQSGGWRWAWVLAGAGLAVAGALLTVLGAVRLRSRRPAVR